MNLENATDNQLLKEILKKLLELNSKMSENQGFIVVSQDQTECKTHENDTPEDEQFARLRSWKVAIGLILTSILAVLSYKFFLELFGISLGLFFVFLGVGMWILLDHILLQANSLKKVSYEPISSAIVMLCIVVLFVSGISFGNSYISQPAGSTEYSQSEPSSSSIRTNSRESDTTANSNTNTNTFDSLKIGNTRDSER